MSNRPVRPAARAQKGQVMMLFGLMAILLFTIAGLSIDAGMSYLSSDRAERAAAAAALAGVAYLPGDPTSANNAALVEAARNGFKNQGTNNACTATQLPCVTMSQPASNQLQVNIKVSVNTTFLRLVGFGSHNVLRSATAEYLPPIELGQPGAQQGSPLSGSCDGSGGSPYCTAPGSGLGSGGNNYYFERTEGWGNPRSEGDPFTPSSLDTSTACSGYACTANPVDAHLISTRTGSESSDPSLEYGGGYNYLITVPAGQKADVQVFNPSFAPDHNDQNGAYSYHENDGSFPNASTTATDYSAMSYTVYSISTLSSRISDKKLSQEVFYPYNATGLYTYGAAVGTLPSYYYFPAGGTGTATTVTGYTPQSYHTWTDALQYSPSNANDINLFKHTRFNGFSSTQYLDNTLGTSTKYWRLRVDDTAWNGQATCTSSGCSTPDTASSNPNSKAHKGYAVRVTAAPGTTACTNCTISAMGDMCLYTPINAGTSSLQFAIPLFRLDAAYAGRQITVDMFDPGDVGGGPAYVGLQLPGSTTYAQAVSMTAVGTSIKHGNTTPVASLGTWPGTGGGSCSACYQSANATGGSIFNGQWIEMVIQVPQTFDATSYFSLVYDVSAGTKAGDTFTVQVGYAGSPDHLLP